MDSDRARWRKLFAYSRHARTPCRSSMLYVPARKSLSNGQTSACGKGLRQGQAARVPLEVVVLELVAHVRHPDFTYVFADREQGNVA